MHLRLRELWVIIATHRGAVGVWQLTGGVQGHTTGDEGVAAYTSEARCASGGLWSGGGALTSEVWRLDLGELRWERLPDLTTGRYAHARCVVRREVAVLGGSVAGRAGVEAGDGADGDEEDEKQHADKLG